MKAILLVLATVAMLQPIEAISAEERCSISSGSWVVTKDDETPMVEAINEARRDGAPVWAIGTEFTMSRPTGAVLSDDAKRRVMFRWSREIGVHFLRNGFHQTAKVPNADAVFAEMKKKLPYNQQEDFDEMRGPLLFMIHDDGRRCRGRDGAIGAYAFMTYPRPGVGSDWGGVFVAFVGYGDCGNPGARASTRKALRDINLHMCLDLKE